MECQLGFERCSFGKIQFLIPPKKSLSLSIIPKRLSLEFLRVFPPKLSPQIGFTGVRNWVPFNDPSSIHPGQNKTTKIKKSPTGPTERTPKKTWVSNSSIATYLGVRWDSVPFNFWWSSATKHKIIIKGDSRDSGKLTILFPYRSHIFRDL